MRPVALGLCVAALGCTPIAIDEDYPESELSVGFAVEVDLAGKETVTAPPPPAPVLPPDDKLSEVVIVPFKLEVTESLNQELYTFPDCEQEILGTRKWGALCLAYENFMGSLAEWQSKAYQKNVPIEPSTKTYGWGLILGSSYRIKLNVEDPRATCVLRAQTCDGAGWQEVRGAEIAGNALPGELFAGCPLANQQRVQVQCGNDLYEVWFNLQSELRSSHLFFDDDIPGPMFNLADVVDGLKRLQSKKVDAIGTNLLEVEGFVSSFGSLPAKWNQDIFFAKLDNQPVPKSIFRHPSEYLQATTQGDFIEPLAFFADFFFFTRMGKIFVFVKSSDKSVYRFHQVVPVSYAQMQCGRYSTGPAYPNGWGGGGIYSAELGRISECYYREVILPQLTADAQEFHANVMSLGLLVLSLVNPTATALGMGTGLILDPNASYGERATGVVLLVAGAAGVTSMCAVPGSLASSASQATVFTANATLVGISGYRIVTGTGEFADYLVFGMTAIGLATNPEFLATRSLRFQTRVPPQVSAATPAGLSKGIAADGATPIPPNTIQAVSRSFGRGAIVDARGNPIEPRPGAIDQFVHNRNIKAYLETAQGLKPQKVGQVGGMELIPVALKPAPPTPAEVLVPVAYQSGVRNDVLLALEDKAIGLTWHDTWWPGRTRLTDIPALKRRFLGGDGVEVAPGKWRSEDGLREFRFKLNDLAGDHPIGEIPETTVPGFAGELFEGAKIGHVHLVEFAAPVTRANGTQYLPVKSNIHVPLDACSR